MGQNSDELIDIAVNTSKMKQAANKELGITQEYNAKNRDTLWEGNYGTKAKKEYRDKTFGTNINGSEKQTYVDPVTEKMLHKSHNAAKNKYHAQNENGEYISSEWAKHAAEVDHVVTLKEGHDKFKNNPFLTDSDFQEVMNSEENFRIFSKSENTSKGGKSEWDFISDKEGSLSPESKKQLVKGKIRADVVVQGKVATRTAQNMGAEFVAGAKDTLAESVVPLTVEAIQRMMAVAQNEESLGDAINGMAKTTVDVAVAGGTNKLLIDTVSHRLMTSDNPILKSLANNGELGKIVAVASIVQECAVKYVNGEISGQEFINEIGTKGTNMVVGMIGGEIGGEIGMLIGGVLGTAALPGLGTVEGATAGKVVGEILGTIITTVACSAVMTAFNTVKHMEDYKLTENNIRRIEKEALEEMANQRDKFRKIVEREYKVWDETIENGFDQILSCACRETADVTGVSEGIDKVLSVFGKSVRFKNLDEYEAQLDLPLKLSF